MRTADRKDRDTHRQATAATVKETRTTTPEATSRDVTTLTDNKSAQPSGMSDILASMVTSLILVRSINPLS